MLHRASILFVLIFSSALRFAQAANYYFDVNGSVNGSGVTNGGIYNVTNSIWSTSSAGTSATGNFPGRNAPVFAAGTDADGLSYALTGSFGQVSGGLTVEEGNVTIAGDGTFFSGGVVQTFAGTSLNFTPSSWDFYGYSMTFDAAAGTTITLNSISTASGRGGGVTKISPGLLVITGAASARGIVVNANGGELRLQDSNAIYNSSFPPPSHTYVTTVNTGSSLELANNLTLANNPITLNGAGFKGLGALRNVANTNTFASPITLASASRINADTNTQLTLNPSGTNAVNGAFDLTLGGDGTTTVAQPIADVTSLIKDGNGIVTLTASNLFSGPTIISNGVLRLVNGSVAGDITNNATLVISNAAAQTLANRIAGSGQIIKQSGNRLTLAATNSFAGSIFVNSGTLALTANASIANAGQIFVTNGAVLDISPVSGFTLNSGQTIGGSGVVTGAVTTASGAVISPGFAGAPGVLSFSNSLTLTGGATNYFDLSASTNGANDQIFVGGNFSFNGANFIRINYAALTNGTYKLIRTGGSVAGNVSSLQLLGFVGGAQTASLATNAAGTEIDLVVAPSSHVPANLTWTGDGGNNFWDETNSLTWRNGVAPAFFYQSDFVTFDDSGATNPLVNLSGALAPAALTVNATNNFSFGGSGGLIGAMSLVKSNSGVLAISTTNTFSGGTLIAGGTLQINNSAALGTGAVTNNSALVFNPASSLAFTNVTSGNGSLTNLGGTLILSGSNAFTGSLTVSAGTLQLANSAALGATSGATVLNNSATLDLNGQNLGAEPVTLAGGNLINGNFSSASLAGAVTITSNSVLAGVGDFDLTGGVNGTAALTKSDANTVTISGAGNLSGLTTIASGALMLNGNSGAGGVIINSGATLGGNGVIRGAVTNLAGGTISFGTNFCRLTVSNTLTLASGSTTILKVGRANSQPTNDAIAGITSLVRGGTLTVTLAGNSVQAGDAFQLFPPANVSGTFSSINLPWLVGGLVWDASALTNGVLRVVALPGVSSFSQRRQWILDQASENPDAVNDDFVLAEVYFTRGDIALGQSTALAASRAMTNNVQVDFFNIWPAMDCYIRFNQYLDDETKNNIKTNVTTCTQYAGTSTSNLKTMGHVIRYLGSEQFGEAAFATNAIWRANDPNAYLDTLALLGSVATNGYGEHASRPYYDKNILPILTLAQLATNPIIAKRAMLAFQGGLSQNAGCWMRGHLGVSTGRSYPDEETQTPMGSMRLLWLWFGGDAPPTSYEFPALAAVMNYEPLPVIQMAATNRSPPYNSRGGYFGAQQNSFVDRDYILFSEGPEYYGNFQVYADGAMWCDPDDNHFSFLWLCAPWNDDPAVVSGSWPHGMNRAVYSEAQCRDSLLQSYNFNPADTNQPPYVLCYVPGGWRAAVNDAATAGKIFLHYGTVMIAINAEPTFKWDTNSGIYAVSQSPTRAGDSEFRIWGAPIPAAMQSVSNLANSFIGTWTNQFAMAIETARPDLYPGATPADQLAAFRADIYTHTSLSHAAGSPPTGYYTNRHGDTLQVKQTSALAPSPILINGQPQDFANWPLTDNLWIYQPLGGNLSLYDGTQTIVYDFNAWSITTNSSVPPPTGLLATANRNGVFLTWCAHVGAISYNVKRATSSGGPYVSVGTTTNTAFTDTTAANGTNYFYVATAVNPSGESTNSNEAVVTTLPATPAGLNATLSGRTVNLNWNPASGAVSYNVKRATSASGPFVSLARGLTKTSFSDQQFSGGGTFYYVVSAANAVGESPDSAPASVSVAANYFAAWSNRCAISFPDYAAPETLTNFPALIILNSSRSNFSYAQFDSPFGRDLRFSDASLNELNYEIEKWNPNGSSFVWVQIPALTNSTLIYAWWGNPAATNVPAYTTNGAAWTQNFLGVWHLAETNGAHRDSSPNLAVSRSVAATQEGMATGVIGGCDFFNGTSDFVSLPDMSTQAQVTVECWVNLNGTPAGTDIGLVSSDPWITGITHFKTSSTFQIKAQLNGGSGATSANNVVTSNQWFYAAYTMSGSGSTDLDTFLNGTLLASGTGSTANNLTDVNIAREYNGRYLKGNVDEVRVSSVARSPKWLWATYQNIASNSVFNCYAATTALTTNLVPKFAAFSLAGGQPNFSVSGAAGFSYVVQASTNLSDWSNLFTNPPGASLFDWTDASAGIFPQRYYRVLLAP